LFVFLQYARVGLCRNRGQPEEAEASEKLKLLKTWKTLERQNLEERQIFCCAVGSMIDDLSKILNLMMADVKTTAV